MQEEMNSSAPEDQKPTNYAEKQYFLNVHNKNPKISPAYRESVKPV